MDFELKNGKYYLEDGTILSEEEFEDLYEPCSWCGTIHPKDEMICTEDTKKWFCGSCSGRHVVQCYDCGDPIENPLYFDDSSHPFCEECYDSQFNYGSGHYCVFCERDFYYDDSGNYDNNDEWVCNSCQNRGRGDFDSNLIGDYHDFKEYGDIEFCGKEKRTEAEFMGFELEIDDGSENLKLAKKIYSRFDSFFHCESDGSLHTGFEIISQPASLSYHMNNMSDYAAMFEDAVSMGYTSHNSGRCGLHIHLDKRYFEDKLDLAEAKLLYIFEKHWTNLVRFSRRKSSQLHWCGRYDGRPSKIIKDLKEYGEDDFDRYYAINLTNYDTIEIRLWRGTLNPQTFEATLRFTNRLAEICKKYSVIKISRMSFEELLGDDEVVKAYWERVKDRIV